jgi:outer membrane protein TolC
MIVYRKNKWANRILLLAMLLVTMMGEATAQRDSAKLLKLAEAITAATTNNSSVKLAKQDEQIALAKYHQTEAVYLPQVGLSYTAMSTNNPLNAFGFKLQQKSIAAADFNPATLNHPNATPDFTTKLDLQQPIINMDMLYLRKAAAVQKDIYAYKTERTQEYIAFEVKKAYLQLGVTYDAVKVLEEALTTAKQIKKYATDYYNQGLVQKTEVLNAEVFVATTETNLAKAKSNIYNASDYLGLLMGKGTGVVYTVEEVSPIVIKDAAKLSDSRPDFMAMQKGIEASNCMIQSSKMAAYPKLNAFASYQLNDASMTGFGANAYLAGVQLSWNIFSGNRNKNAIATQQLERNKMADELLQQKEQNAVELNKTQRDIADAQTEILQHQSSIRQAEERLRMLQNRFEQGLVNTTDIMMATTQVSQEKLANRQALFNLNLSQAYLQLLISSSSKTK